MAYGEPQTLTINAIAQDCRRTGTGMDEGAFRTSDGLVTLSIRHRKLSGGRVLHQVQAGQQLLAADPLDPSINRLNKMTVTVSVNVPDAGYIPVGTQKYLVDALLAWATASSGAKITQLLGGES